MDPVSPPPAQYRDSTNLRARAALPVKYGTRDWFGWVALHLPLKPGDHVLDIGCGAGWFWARTALSLPQVSLTLADKSPGMVAEAMKNAEAVTDRTGVTADASDLPFDENSFDLILAMHMLYHVPEPERALGHFKAKLKRGATLALTTNAISDDPIWHINAQVFGHPPEDPAARVFGAHHAEALLQKVFGNARIEHFTETWRVTDPEDIFHFLMSLPWVSSADEPTLSRLRSTIDEAFKASGVLEIPRHSVVALANN